MIKVSLGEVSQIKKLNVTPDGLTGRNTYHSETLIFIIKSIFKPKYYYIINTYYGIFGI
jgi:hypothetical protein